MYLLENRLPKYNGKVENTTTGVKLATGWKFPKGVKAMYDPAYEHRNNMNMGSCTQEQHNQSP